MILMLILSVVSCGKEEVPLRGTVTLSSKILPSDLSFYAVGFNFTTARFSRTDQTPFPQIVLRADTDVSGLITAVSFNGDTGFAYSPFALEGSYGTAAEASAAFNALNDIDPSDYVWSEMGRPVTVNQVWLFRTRDERYARMRILAVSEIYSEDAPYAECRFEWVFQPDGSTSFP